MLQTLLMIFDKPLLIWMGLQILSRQRYKWSHLTLYGALTAVLEYYGYSLTGEWIKPSLFIFAFILIMPNVIPRFKKDNWLIEMKINYFYLSSVFMIGMLGRAWGQLIAHRIALAFDWYDVVIRNNDSTFAEIYEEPLALIFKMLICFILFFMTRDLLHRSKVVEIIKKADIEYSTLLIIGMGVVFICYYAVIFLPILFNIACSGMLQMMPIYLTILAIITSGLIFLFNGLIRKELILIKSNTALAHAGVQLNQKDKEIEEKESVINLLDGKVLGMENVTKLVRDFNHGSNELKLAILGGFESGKKHIIDDLAKQYSMKTDEVESYCVDFDSVNQLIGDELLVIRKFLYAKIAKATQALLEFTVEIPTSITEIGMPSLDLIDILGVWLNNAIEEAMYTEEKWIHLSFILDSAPEKGTVLEIRVSNSCREDALSPSLAKQEGVSTKGEGRGRGLQIVDKIMLSHDHVYVTTVKNGRKFIQLLEVYFMNLDDE